MKKEILNNFKEERNSLREKLFDNGFKTEKELEEFQEKNKSDFERYYSLVEQIRQLEWDLMTPEEQARDLEVRRLIKLKTGQIKKED